MDFNNGPNFAQMGHEFERQRNEQFKRTKIAYINSVEFDYSNTKNSPSISEIGKYDTGLKNGLFDGNASLPPVNKPTFSDVSEKRGYIDGFKRTI